MCSKVEAPMAHVQSRVSPCQKIVAKRSPTPHTVCISRPRCKHSTEWISGGQSRHFLGSIHYLNYPKSEDQSSPHWFGTTGLSPVTTNNTRTTTTAAAIYTATTTTFDTTPSTFTTITNTITTTTVFIFTTASLIFSCASDVATSSITL
ncbi:hypothetical protein QQF64_034732 [Cirrhinus molitorella]|uniref:Uncharacterized protein n=1 Tax=Cirrhinus molitorella TaxID=172907 RepID=A0ABR3L4D6_9TELE